MNPKIWFYYSASISYTFKPVTLALSSSSVQPRRWIVDSSLVPVLYNFPWAHHLKDSTRGLIPKPGFILDSTAAIP